MSANKFSTSSSRHRPVTLEERVNLQEGEDSLSSGDDDLDMPTRRQKRRDIDLDAYIDSFGSTVADKLVEVSSDTQDELADKPAKRQKLSIGPGHGVRMKFDDDESDDAAYRQFKARKTEKRKKAIAATKKAKATVAKKDSMVGRRARNNVPSSSRKKRGTRIYGQEDDEDDAGMEWELPGDLQERFRARESLGEAGLRMPPSYEDVDFSDDDRLADIAERPKLPESMLQRPYEDITLSISQGVVPAPIAQYLRPYQIDGADFLLRHFITQSGCILGDDMGLGKTIQIIAFLTAAFGKTGDERDAKRMRKMRRLERSSDEGVWYPRVLMILPGGLLANWQAELERWGWWTTYLYHGNAGQKDSALSAAASGRSEIMLTTYDTYRLNESAINTVQWDAVIADECHKIKELKSDVTQALNRVNALCRIGMTGTAIQNKYEELWTLLNWTNPGRFGPISNWKAMICLPLKMGQSHDATYSQLAKSRRTATKLVQNLLPPYFLRRTKELIKAQLPKKSDRVVFCPMTPVQLEAYDNFCSSEAVTCIREASELCTCGSGKKAGYCCNTLIEVRGELIKWQHYVFPALMTLQKIANHIALLLPGGETDREQHEKDVDKLSTALPEGWKDLYRERDNIRHFANQAFCGKWRVLKRLLKLWHDNGDKVLVFSHSVKLLKMLQLLFKTTTSYNVSYLDGSMTYQDRQNSVDEFNSSDDQFVFLISTKAGGIGLNITSANKVVVVDPNWNPSYDLQAQDRAYRIGQTRDVEVFRLVSKGTVEEIVYARQIYKQQQANIGYNASVERRYFRGVQDQKEMKGEIFGLKNLFAAVSENVVLREIVNKTNVAETRAGVEIAGLDLESASSASQMGNGDDDEDGGGGGAGNMWEDVKEDDAMSQLAADIIDAPASRRKKANEKAKKRDPVAAILASVGVEYTHENAEVIGTSKIETRISSRAQKAGNDLDFDQDKAFGFGSSQAGPDVSEQNETVNVGGVVGFDNEDLDHHGLGKIRYRYRPAMDVRQRQFCSMARQFGYEDVTEFALVVEGWTMEERREFLEGFYRDRRQKLAG
ncbi:DNA excision repair protein [Hortaea werneckii]|nr:DNA excision repair protein [Hortaea werneckii]